MPPSDVVHDIWMSGLSLCAAAWGWITLTRWGNSESSFFGVRVDNKFEDSADRQQIDSRYIHEIIILTGTLIVFSTFLLLYFRHFAANPSLPFLAARIATGLRGSLRILEGAQQHVAVCRTHRLGADRGFSVSQQSFTYLELILLADCFCPACSGWDLRILFAISLDDSLVSVCRQFSSDGKFADDCLVAAYFPASVLAAGVDVACEYHWRGVCVRV